MKCNLIFAKNPADHTTVVLPLYWVFEVKSLTTVDVQFLYV